MSKKHECPRCAFCTGSVCMFNQHVKTLCEPKDASRADIVPTAIKRKKRVPAPVPVVEEAAEAPPVVPQRFPFQNYDHLSVKDKRAIVRLAGNGTPEGFVKALVRVLDASYFNDAQPHNVNIAVVDGLAFVIGKDEATKAMSLDRAVDMMIDEGGCTLYNLTDDDALGGKVSEKTVAAIDDAYLAYAHCDPKVKRTLIDRATKLGAKPHRRIVDGLFEAAKKAAEHEALMRSHLQPVPRPHELPSEEPPTIAVHPQ